MLGAGHVMNYVEAQRYCTMGYGNPGSVHSASSRYVDDLSVAIQSQWFEHS